ncbi:MAG: heavy metal translocating P-type ATPase [Betaproteobacteria bacterium]|nr:heavy metal translocating P-type ATPase [Betaproteobacteria bacterium]
MNTATLTSGDWSAATHAECFHCALPVPKGASWSVLFDGQSRALCCAGCEAVARTILDNGLQDYYRKRTAQAGIAAGAGQVDATLREALARAARIDAVAPAPPRASGQQAHLRLALEGITCAACAWLAERTLSRVTGVTQASVHYVTHIATIEFDPVMTSPGALAGAIARVGLTATPVAANGAEDRRARRRRDAWELGVAVFSMMQAMMFTVPFYFSEPGSIEPDVMALMNVAAMLVTIPAIVFSARRFFAGAWRDVSHGRIGMDVPVAVAIAATFATSVAAAFAGSGATYFDSIGMFVSLLLAARWFESGLRDRALDTLERARANHPAHARRAMANGAVETIAAPNIAPDDVLLLEPGDVLATDGVTLDSPSEWNEAVLTGESRPVVRAPGVAVPAGAVLVGAAVRVRATRRASESTLARIAQWTEAALAGRANLSRSLDRLAAWIAPASLFLALSGAMAWWWIEPSRAFDVAVAVLAITCPCALALAAPSVLAGAHFAAAKNGWLIADVAALESARRVTHVVFDKTGTLTGGRPTISRVQILGSLSENECIAIACALEQGSAHPVASALFERATESAMRLPNAIGVTVHAGLGVSGCVDGQCYRLGTRNFAEGCDALADNGALWLAGPAGPLACIDLEDALRATAKAAVSQLAALGVESRIASGDAACNVEPLAQQLGLEPDRVRARLKPDQKAAWVRELQADGATVALVGDGINDAPAMAAADVAIAMSGGADLARNTAGAVMRSPLLTAVPQLITLSRKLHDLTRQNLAWALLYNAFAIPAALAGWVTPAHAAIGMAASSLLVIANAARVARTPRPRG